VSEYSIFWGEAHDNTYQYDEMPAPFDEVLRRAASHLDFYAAAYYTACASAFRPGGHITEKSSGGGLPLEGWKPRERLDREWNAVQEATRRFNSDGSFVTFPGYEWQGDGSPGDHNVFFLREGAPVFVVDSLSELYRNLRGMDALAIPHHVGYRPGRRGRDWSVWDPELSPFAEIYSIHGCSETDEEWIGLRNNYHMGPGQSGGTYQDALDRGYRLGAVCSTDNWGDMPGRHGNGRMACLASELTRESLWDAFKARRVYGVTGDRIELDFTLNGAPMGSVVPSDPGPRRIRVKVSGSDALDRIELLRGNRVIATHCHQGTWSVPVPGRPTRFKVRVESGWGPASGEVDVPNRQWEGALEVPGGRIVGYEPCWISPGQEPPVIDGDTARIRMCSSTATATDIPQNAVVFELECDPADPLRVTMNGLEERSTMVDLCGGSRSMWFRDECMRMLAVRAGIPEGSPEREDIYWHVAYKTKLHRAIPEAGYTAEFEFEDDEPLDGSAAGARHYRVRVEQRNGQRAWSSPIWIGDEE